MDYKITNFDVAAEQVCLEQTAELPVDADFMVADYMGEIKRILKCRITPYITAKHISGNALTVEGTAAIAVIYYDTDGDIVSAEHEVPFKKTFEANRLIDDGYCSANVDASCHSCRSITERKLSIKGSVKVEAKVTVIEKNKIISDIDSDCFEQLKGEAPATTPMGIVQKSLVIDEEITLPQSLPAAHHIIRNDATATVTDCKVITNKVIVKGNLCVSMLYCTTENEYKKHSSNIPFNQIIDLVGVEAECECEATVQICGLNLSTRTSEDGQCRKFMVVSKLDISISARCNSNIPVIFDAYSTRYSSTPHTNDIEFTYIVKQINERFLCKKNLTLPDGGINKILDIWCDLSGCNSRRDERGIIISGALMVCTLFCDHEGEPGCFERVIDFEYPISLEGELHTPRCHPEIKVTANDYIFSGGEPELKVELLICATVYDTKTISLITEIEMDENAPLLSDAALVAYYADKGENVWEICKNFLANRGEMMELNHITEETVQNPKMLLIPLSQSIHT